MSQSTPTVVVVGAGLAGLTVARELAQHGFAVTLLEKANRAGGKAGSPEPVADGSQGVPGVCYEHGYHIFAPWYRNVFRITNELGIALRPVRRWHYKTRTDGWKSLFLPSTPRELLEVLRNSPLPPADTLLYFYFVLDMIGQPIKARRRAELDRMTRLGMMSSRWYTTPALPQIEEESILKAAAVPVHEMSAYTAKILSSYFLWTLKPTNLLRMLRPQAEPEPSLYMLPGDLQEAFIDPYVQAVTAAGVDIRFGQEVRRITLQDGGTGGAPGTIAAVEAVPTGRPDAPAQTYTADVFVIATPLDVTQRLLNLSELLALEPMIGRINHLRTAPMAALQLTLRTPVQGLPAEHCFLMGGEYGLSFIDLSPHWDNPPYTLSFISSNFAPLQYLSRAQQYERLIDEIGQFLPVRPQDVTHWCLLPNSDLGHQLFINTVGAWTNRPRAKATNIGNLFFAGDWVKNRIDLACMEGAVTSALATARAVALSRRSAPGVSIPAGPLVAGRYPPQLIRAAVLLLAPLALCTYAWASWGSRTR